MARSLFVIFGLSVLLTACATIQVNTALPVVIKAEDLVGRGYERIGVVQVGRERFGADVLNVDDYSWAQTSLQEEARKLGADAILQPELSVHAQSLILFPRTEVRARATAIRFR